MNVFEKSLLFHSHVIQRMNGIIFFTLNATTCVYKMHTTKKNNNNNNKIEINLQSLVVLFYAFIELKPDYFTPMQ